MKISKDVIIPVIFLLCIVGFTIAGVSNNIFVMCLYFCLSILLINQIEGILAVMCVTSPIAYYFTGIDEGLYSIYSIFLVVVLIKLMLSKGKAEVSIKDILLKLMFIGVVIISYVQSPFGYTNGMIELVYVVIVSVVIVSFMSIDIDRFIHILIPLSCLMVIIYLFAMVLGGVVIEGRFHIAEDVNTNTSGMACVQLGIIIVASTVCGLHSIKKIIIVPVFLTDIILVILSGSRTSLFSLLASTGLILVIIASRNNSLSNKARRLLFVLFVLGLLFVFVSENIGIGLTKYDYVELLKGGGTNRFAIFAAVIPYVIMNGFWKFGYGPGHECSRIVVTKLIGRNYSHTHNLFIEAFAELGIVGLSIFVIILIESIKNVLIKARSNVAYYVPFGMIIGLLINGLAETYFCDAYLWIVLAICMKRGDSKIEQY